MPTNREFFTHTALAKGLKALFVELEGRLGLYAPMNVYLAGGMAVHLYTATRVTTDIDAEFAGRVSIPNDMMVEVTLEDGVKRVVYIDTNYNSSFALMHEDYQDDAIAVDLGLQHLRVHVLSPVDLAVSKIARFSDHDKEDIATLVHLGLTSADDIERRATAALVGFVGNQNTLKWNLQNAVVLARKAESERTGAPRWTKLSC